MLGYVTNWYNVGNVLNGKVYLGTILFGFDEISRRVVDRCMCLKRSFVRVKLVKSD